MPKIFTFDLDEYKPGISYHPPSTIYAWDVDGLLEHRFFYKSGGQLTGEHEPEITKYRVWKEGDSSTPTTMYAVPYFDGVRGPRSGPVTVNQGSGGGFVLSNSASLSEPGNVSKLKEAPNESATSWRPFTFTNLGKGPYRRVDGGVRNGVHTFYYVPDSNGTISYTDSPPVSYSSGDKMITGEAYVNGSRRDRQGPVGTNHGSGGGGENP